MVIISLLNIQLPIKHLYPSRKEHHLPEYLNKEEVKRMISNTDNLKHKCILEMLYSGGLRLSELRNIQITDVDSDDMIIHIRMAKGKKDRRESLGHKSVKTTEIYTHIVDISKSSIKSPLDLM